MKVTVIKGPHFKQRREQVYKLLYKIISTELRQEETKQNVSIAKGRETR